MQNDAVFGLFESEFFALVGCVVVVFVCFLIHLVLFEACAAFVWKEMTS